MPLIISSSTLDAAGCESQLLDTTKPRYGKAGEARQGQAAHRVLERYLLHLHRARRSTDFEEANRIWQDVRGQLSSADAAGIGPAIERALMSDSYEWVADAERLEGERTVFITLEGVQVPADRAHQIDGVLFRFTRDLAWVGSPPTGGDRGVHILDWKSHRRIEHVASPGLNAQLRRYAAASWAAGLVPRGEPVSLWVGYVRHGWYESVVLQEAELAAAWEELQQACRSVVATLDSLRMRPPSPTVSSRCVQCDLRRGCDAALRYPMELPLLEGVAPAQVVTATKLLEALLRDYKYKLKEQLELEAGPVDDGEYEAEIDETVQRSYPRASLLRVVGQHLSTQDVDALSSVSHTRLEEALRRAKVKPDLRAELFGELAADATVKKGTRLSVRKKAAPKAEVADVPAEEV